MAEVVGVRFKEVGKVYYFDPDGHSLKKGDMVIVETARGVECGEVAMENRDVSEEEIVKPLKKLVRVATDEDIDKVKENKKKEKEAFEICEKKILKHGLDMKLVDIEYTFDNSKILFYFTADGRVDFRELVKDLASVFHTRIELRQIGVRDESKMLGGIGICGRPFCCSSFLGDFQPVTVKMAKEQGLSLNPTKISGTCGRLMCCLKYEQNAYDHLLRITPKTGAIVETPEGRGKVVDVNILRGIVKVQLDKKADAAPAAYDRRDVKVIRDKKIQVEKDELEALKDIE
ncbi:MAG: stage 0 sporulation family protein [Oscillospiraceae bacterium]|nr:stage 0 sporulation family protein [Ruminococcus sp.]MDY6062028.1 stage 0 sporulation family protein [Oscillospiraceae bacterium]